MAGAAPRVPVTVTTDYLYVLKDLRRLGILAATFFAILVAVGVVVSVEVTVGVKVFVASAQAELVSDMVWSPTPGRPSIQTTVIV